MVIQSIGHLMDELQRHHGVFRGLPDRSYGLLTTLDRFNQAQGMGSNFERRLFVEFKQQARPHFRVPPQNEWEVLVVAQHYGLPTRLLDWTYSPLVAAHFATTGAEDAQADGVIWHLDWQALHERLGFPPTPFTLDMLQSEFEARGEGRDLWSLFYPDPGQATRPDFVLLLEPPALEERMTGQQAAFTLASALDHPLDVLLDERGVYDVLKRFVIPASVKRDIRIALDRCQVNERSLLPGMDGIARAIRREMSIPEGPTRRLHEIHARSDKETAQRVRPLRKA